MLRNLFKKTAVYLFTLGLGKLLSVVMFALLARILLPEKFGEITVFMTATQLLTVIFDLGLKQWYQKQAAKLEEKGAALKEAKNKLLANVLGSRLGLVVVSIGAMVVLNPWWPKAPSELLSLMAIVLLVEALFSVADAYYLEKRESLWLGVKLIGRNLLLFGCFFFVKGPETVGYFYMFYVISLVLVMIFYFPWRAVRDSFKWAKIWLETKLWKKSSSYGLMDIWSILYSRADSVLVDLLIGNAALGIYSAAYRILDGFNLIPQALFHNLFPEASKKGNINWKQMWKIEGLMTAAGLGLGIVTWIFADWIIVLIMGAEYIEAGAILRILAIVNLLFFINAPFNTIIQSSDHLKKYLPWMGGIVAINIVANLILIPWLGPIGAAWAMVVSQSCLIGVNYWFVRKIYQ